MQTQGSLKAGGALGDLAVVLTSVVVSKKKPTILGLVDIAEMLDVTKQRADRLRRRPDFPAPVGSWARGDLWSERDVRRWARSCGGGLTV